jgi:hypothetical protein
MNDGIMPAFLEGSLIQPDPTDEADTQRPRGFADPDILARAQQARKDNRPPSEGVDLGGLAPDVVAPKRGRPAGARKKDLEGLETMVLLGCAGLGMIGAALTGISEIEEDLTVDKDEAKMLAEAMNTFASQYKVKLDGKSGAALGLVTAAVVVFGPRSVVVIKRIRDRNAGSSQTT